MITQITGEDKNILSNVAGESVWLFIGNSVAIKRIAERFCYGSMMQAWHDIIEKGILELTQLCDMDNAIEKENKKC